MRRSSGSAARVTRKAPRRLTACWTSHALVVVSAIEPRHADPGRVDEHVDAAVALEVLGDEPETVVLARDVRLHDRGVQALAGGFEAIELAAGERQGIALLGQHPRDREADPGRATGDEG